MLTPEELRAKEIREAYLAEVGAWLGPRLQPLEAYESLQELREHLDAMAAAHQEFGLGADDAMIESVKKFGAPKRVGVSLAIASGSSRSQTLIRQVTPPLALFLTMALSSVPAFFLLEAINWSFVWLFGGHAMPVTLIDPIAWLLSAIISPLAWMARKWKPLTFGFAAAGLLNLIIAPTLYPSYIAVHEPGLLAHFAISVTGTIFLLATAASATVSRFFPAQAPRLAKHAS